MGQFWVTILFKITLVLSEVVEIPNLALYHVTPQTEAQMRYLNKLRTSDSGVMFIHGIGALEETIEILASPAAMEIHGKDMYDIKLDFEMQFDPVTIEMSNEGIENKGPELSAEDALKAVAAAENNKTALEYSPIEPMAPPDVFSGIFLEISPFSNLDVDVLSFGGKINSTMGNPYLCFAVKKSVDEGDSVLKQWIFEKSEREGYYVLRNRKIPHGYITWEDDQEQYLVVEMRREFQRLYQRDTGPLRKNVLFKVTEVSKDDDQIAYRIGVKGMDNEDTHVVIEPTWKESSGCYLLRRTFREVSNDGNELEFLFKIEKANAAMKIMGILEDFKYKETVEGLYKRAVQGNTTTGLTSRQVFNHGKYPLEIGIEDAYEMTDKFHIKFTGSNSLDVFEEIWVPPGLSIGVTMSENSTEKPSLVKLGSPGRDTVEKFKYRITGAVQVPPWSSIQYTVMFGWLEKISMDFEATLRIVGKGDRMTLADRPKVVTDQHLTFGYVYDALTRRGFIMDANQNDPEKFSGSVKIKGTIFAKSLGIKGDVEMKVKGLSQDISTTCHHSKQ